MILSIERFNSPYDMGRIESVLIYLDHSFEMLMKSAILFRGGKIREPREKQTLGFDACLRKGLSDGSVKFLNEEQVLNLQTINTLRDAAQHHLLDISEQHLYIHIQSGLSIFKEIYQEVFKEDLILKLPHRVLPLSTTPPIELHALFANEITEIKKLLQPNVRKVIEAKTKLRALAITEGAVQGEKIQPGEYQLAKIGKEIKIGVDWKKIFPGIASLNLTTKGHGPSIDLRITQNKGVPISLVPEGTPGASVVAVRKIDALSFYNLGRDQLALKVGLSGPKTTAIIEHLKLKDDSDCYREFTIGKSIYKRYSQKTIEKIKDAKSKLSISKVWQAYIRNQRKR